MDDYSGRFFIFIGPRVVAFPVPIETVTGRQSHVSEFCASHGPWFVQSIERPMRTSPHTFGDEQGSV